MTAGMHFERVAPLYADARPPYPRALYDVLRKGSVVGPGMRVLEVGAGSGQATAELVACGCQVTAVEPGRDLAQRLRNTAPEVRVIQSTLEDAILPPGEFDSVVAATAMHWVDLGHCLPRLHRSLVERGHLAVWRTIYGDPRVPTPFRDAVGRIVAARSKNLATVDPLDPPPRVSDLVEGGWFVHTATWTYPWHVDLTVEQVCRLFQTFSDWSSEDLEALSREAERLGPSITEHYVTRLHLLQRS